MGTVPSSSKGPLFGIAIIMLVLIAGAVYVLFGNYLVKPTPTQNVYIPNDVSTTSVDDTTNIQGE